MALGGDMGCWAFLRRSIRAPLAMQPPGVVTWLDQYVCGISAGGQRRDASFTSLASR
jgi:hypothetical protein